MSISTTNSTDVSPATTTGEVRRALGLPSLLDEYRSEIDILDGAIIELVLARAEAAKAAQQFKIDHGIPRTDLKREGEIISRYAGELGVCGPILAHSILNHSKGL